MSKAKELAGEIEDKYSRSKIWDMEDIDSDITDIVYLAVALCREVLKSKDIKGFLEDVSTKGKRRLVHLYYDVVYVEESENLVMRYFEESQVELSMNFDELKQRIKEAS